VRLGIGAAAATLEAVIVHNAYDHDIDAAFEAVSGFAGPPATLDLPLPASSSAWSTGWVDGLSATGNVEQTFRIEVPAALASGFLPPSDSSPWTLRVTEGGFLNRSGRVTRFRLTWHSPGGDVVYDGSPASAPTFEGRDHAPPHPGRNRRDPRRAGSAGRALTSHRPEPLARRRLDRLHDGPGRRLAGARLRPGGPAVGAAALVATDAGRAEARWTARDVRGAASPRASISPARGRAPAQRLVLLGR
jgi:hypothetical protein